MREGQIQNRKFFVESGFDTFGMAHGK
jgi:hypothetical protein